MIPGPANTTEASANGEEKAGEVRRPGAQGPSRRTWATFVAVVLLASGLYTLNAFRLDFGMVGGRPGPGFFPRILGIGLIASCLYILAADWRHYGLGRPEPYRTATVVFGVSGLAFIAGLIVLGTWLAIGLYLFATLTVFNQKRHAFNAALSVVVPLVFFLLFSVWLRVPLPEGMISLVR